MNTFITFRTYGTWVAGDERGAVDKLHNQVGEPVVEPDAALHSQHRRTMKSEPFRLTEVARQIVDATILEVADHRGWTVLALNVLHDHVHVVLSTPNHVSPEKAMNDFKSWATRRLREQGLISADTRVWAGHGSTRYLNSAVSVHAACHYVIHSQQAAPHNHNEPGA